MECTTCDIKTNKTITDCFNKKLGQYVKPNEYLCELCAKDRGYITLSEINKDRENNEL